MSNKTPKKNSVTVEWPTTHFTIGDVQSKYPSIINITLRFRVNKAVEANEIVVIGKIKPAIGRPKLVFAKANPSKELLEAATAAGVLPMTDKTVVKGAVGVTEVKSSTKTPAKSVIPATATSTPATSTVVPATAQKS
jgi:hypothetical protein